MEFGTVEPESPAFGTKVVFVLVLDVDFERRLAAWAGGWQELTAVAEVSGTKWADPIDGIDLLATGFTGFGFPHVPFLYIFIWLRSTHTPFIRTNRPF
jgi:hypothetical protein